MYGNKQDRNDYNIGDSESAQENFDRAAQNLESALERRDQDVKNAMADYIADGVSDDYNGMEQQWNQAGIAVRSVIASLRNSMSENDDIARAALSQARAAIPL